MSGIFGGITTHILDVSRGLPAPDVAVRLEREAEADWIPVSNAVTDSDGRARLLAGEEALLEGNYRLTFAVDTYFSTMGDAAFYPFVQIVFAVRDTRHHHVPLLLSPFGYSTYRGS
jgi:5-hydroxyisourate hydrolase